MQSGAMLGVQTMDGGDDLEYGFVANDRFNRPITLLIGS